MKITTTFWSEEVHEFNKLLYINGNTKEVMFQADLDDNWDTYQFFKNISQFAKSPTMRKTIDSHPYEKQDYYQFAVMEGDKITHIKWFDLIINEKVKISHDIAFETTLIKNNNIPISFGRFPMWYERHVKLPKYREFNIKHRAYKYMANQVRKELFSK
jgi:hypothetical protein